MKINLLNDVKTAVTVFGAVRKARKDGQEVRIKQTKEIPVMTGGVMFNGFYNTIEGCAIAGTHSGVDKETVDIARKTFHALPVEERTPFSIAPKDGGYISRYRYWRNLLSPVLTPKQCNKAMYAILHWFIHLKHMKSVASAAEQPNRERITCCQAPRKEGYARII